VPTLTQPLDVLSAIRTRRAIRRFDPRPLDEGTLRTILDAGRRAGSSKNLQRWSFIVVRDRDRLGQLATLGPWAGHLAGAAVGIALITPDPRGPDQPLSVMWDLGGAAAQMMLAAWSIGVGSCPATVYEHARARELLGYPADRWCEYILSFGYPADPSMLTTPRRAGGRKDLSALVHEERW